MSYEIESGVQMPPSKGGRPRDPEGISQRLRDLSEAPVGSSILFNGVKPTVINALVQRIKHTVDAKFSRRSVDGGVRVWRVG